MNSSTRKSQMNGPATTTTISTRRLIDMTMVSRMLCRRCHQNGRESSMP